MKSIYKLKKLILLFLFMIGAQSLFASPDTVIVQSASGTLLYPTFIAAINAVNGGVHSGTITVLVPAGFRETASTNANFRITASGTVVNPIYIIKDPSTSGDDPILIANNEYVPGSLKEAIVSFVASDYITFSGFDLRENDDNIELTPGENRVTEFGIALFLSSATNGAQHNTIKNNKITLRASYQNSVGIFSTSRSPFNGGILSATNSNGTNSDNKFYNNYMSDVAYGMYFNCPAQTATLVERNDIGSTTSGTGNTIYYGHNANAEAGMNGVWPGFDNTKRAALTFSGGVGNNVINNTIYTQNFFNKSNTAIMHLIPAPAIGLTYTTTISNNTITMDQTAADLVLTGIDFASGLNTATHIVSNNTITIKQSGTGLTAHIAAIKSNFQTFTSTINGNVITMEQTPSVGGLTSNVNGIIATGNSNALTVNSNNILIKQNTGTGPYNAATITYINLSSNSNTIMAEGNTLTANSTYPILNNGTLIGIQQDGNATSLVSIKNNIASIRRTAANGAIYFFRTLATATENKDFISGNTITFTGLTGTTTATGISCLGGFVPSPVLNKQILSNSISISGSNTGLTIGISCGKGNLGEIKSNTITLNTSALNSSGIDIASAFSGTISSNTFDLQSNNLNPISMVGIYAGIGGPFKINYNVFEQMAYTGVLGSNPSLNGIFVGAGNGNEVIKNTIRNFQAGSTTTAGIGSPILNGIIVQNALASTVNRNKIYDLKAWTSGANTVVNGIHLTGSTVAGVTNTVHNNTIGTLSASKAVADNVVRGISITATTVTSTHYVYYNSIYLSATTSSATFGSSGIYHVHNLLSNVNQLYLRNNIVMNLSDHAGGGKTLAFKRTGVSTANYAAVSNDNIYYVKPTDNYYFNGTTFAPTIPAFQALVTPSDSHSDSEQVPFKSTNGNLSEFLHVREDVATKVEGKAMNISGMILDFDSIVRQGNPGYTGTGKAPDTGADEGEFISLSCPVISFTPSFPLCIDVEDMVFPHVLITDAEGVSLTSNLPRVYYRKAGGSWFYQEGVLNTGSTIYSSDWTFTIDIADLGRLVATDLVQYYFEAQDLSPSPYWGRWPITGSASPASYKISVLSGVYTVGLTGDYTTLTKAVDAYNTSCLDGAVTFNLLDSDYSVAETFPLTVTYNSDASSVNTLTIQPATGVTSQIKNVAEAEVFRLEGAEYITINGSNAPVTNAVCPRTVSSRNLTIYGQNLSGTTSQSIVSLVPNSTKGNQYNTIKNCIVQGSSSTFAGINNGGTNLITTPIYNCQYNVFENNQINDAVVGICSKGKNILGKNQSNIIRLNEITSSWSCSYGIHTGFENGIELSGNEINFNSGTAIAGIVVGGSETYTFRLGETRGDEVTNATVSYNKISNIHFFAAAIGIYVSETNSGTTTISNNFIDHVVCTGDASVYNVGAGIYISGSALSLTRVYNNSISMNDESTDYYTGYANTYALAVAASTPPLLDFKNNILSNTETVSSTAVIRAFAIGLNYSSTTGAYTNLLSDYNDLYVSSGSYHYLAQTGGFSTGTNHASMPNWITETGVDSHSKNIEPIFTNKYDLHLMTAVNGNLNGTGTVVSGISNDIDCDTRDLATPDIGADEFVVTYGMIIQDEEIPALNEQGIAVRVDSDSKEVSIVGAPENSTCQWILYNSMGQMIHVQNFKGDAQVNKLSVEGLAPGIYFYQVTSNGELSTGKIRIQ